MNELDSFLASNMLAVWAVLLIASLLLAKIMARKFGRGWVQTLLLIPVVLIATLLTGSILSFALTVHFVGWKVMTMATSDPAAFVAYYLETGLEYCAVVMPISAGVFLFYRSGKRNK